MRREGSDVIQLSGDSANIHGRELRALDNGVGGGVNSLKGPTVTVIALRSMVGGGGVGWTRDVPAVAVLYNIITGDGVDVRGRGVVAVVCFPERVGGVVDRCRTYHMFPFS